MEMTDIYILTGKEHMDITAIGKMLRNTYWAYNRSDEIIERSMIKSDCYGAFLKENDMQVGFLRVVTDDTTFFWICDVVVNERYRKNGIGKALMESIRSDTKYLQMRGFLTTRDAHELYKKIGFIRTDDKNIMSKPFGKELLNEINQK